MWTIVDSPVGELRLVATDGALSALDFVGEPALGETESGTVERFVARAETRPLGERTDDHPLLRETARQLAAYFDRGLERFDLPLAPEGTVFQLAVWSELRKLPYGETAGYGEIASRLGMTGHAARAVGLANGRNPIAIVIPCHRVIGSDGKLTGYGGGVARKRFLLDLEQGSLF